MSWAEWRAYGTRISFRPFSQDFRPGLYYDVPAGLGTHFARLTQDFRVCVTTQKSRWRWNNPIILEPRSGTRM